LDHLEHNSRKRYPRRSARLLAPPTRREPHPQKSGHQRHDEDIKLNKALWHMAEVLRDQGI